MADGGAQLVGRQVELGAFEQALAELEHGRPAAVELVGEPGIGKTRMLAELALRADSRGHVVLSGSASELENDVPFWVFVDALDDYLRGLDPRHLELLAESARAELATVLPSLATHAVGREVALQHERYRSHRAVRELLELIADQQPLVLVLDDVHWADPGSVELLGALIQRPPAGPVLIAVGARPRQLPGRLSSAFARAQRAGSLVQLELGALTHAEADVLLGEAARGAERAGLYEQSGGNPFYLQQLARMLNIGAQPGGAPVPVALAESRVPPSVVAALAEELGLLTRGARTMLEGAAVAGDPFEPELAAAAAALSESAELDAMDELLRLDLVRATELPRRFRFRHPLLRRAVYEATPGGWRLAAHGRSAEALAVIGASAIARAHHVEYSARRGDLSAVAVLREAGEAAAQRTPASSARWFAAAVRLLGDSGPPEARVDMLTALASAQAATGQFAPARDSLLDALVLLSEDAVAQRVALTAACAGIEQLLGRHEVAHARLEHALRTLPDPASALAASLLISLALDAFYRLKFIESRDWGLRALEVARPLDDTPLIAAACAVVALACAFALATEDAEQYRAEAAALIDAMPDAQLAIRLDAMAFLSGAELYLDHFEDSIAHGTRGLTVARATGQGELLPILIQALGSALLVRGQLVEAAELFDGSIEGARLSGNEQTLAWSLLNRAFVGVYLGDPDAALPSVQESVDLTRHLDDSLVSTWSNVMMAVVRSQREEHARAVELLVSSAGGPALPLVPGGWRASFIGVLTGSLLALGRREEAAQTVAAAEAVATTTGLGMAHGWARRARAALALDAGDATAAVEQALASVAACEAAGAAVEAALSQIIAGRALAQTGDRDRAVIELARAVEVLEERGALRWQLEAERELRKLGRSIHRRTRPATGLGVASLTGRELELARLVVDRKTNPEIAALLFLSQKTVETHLTNIFRKVGVSSRVELARAVEGAEPSQ